MKNVKMNFNDTNNLSQQVQTFNDEKQEKPQKEYDNDFERMEQNDSDNIINEYEEELKEGMISGRRENDLINPVSPLTNK